MLLLVWGWSDAAVGLVWSGLMLVLV